MSMAGVAKWLRQWIVVPPFGGSSPLVRPHYRIKLTLTAQDKSTWGHYYPSCLSGALMIMSANCVD